MHINSSYDQRSQPAQFSKSGNDIQMKLIKQLPLLPLLGIGLLLGLAPFTPAPHLFEKFSMLMAGTLVKPIDIFDLLMHGTPVVFLALKLLQLANAKISRL